MGIESPLQRAVSAVTQKLGTEIRLHQKVTGVFQPSDDSVPITDIWYTVKAGISSRRGFMVGGNTQEGEKHFIISAGDLPEGVIITSAWEVVWNSQTFPVTRVDIHGPAEVPIAFEIVTRNAPA